MARILHTTTIDSLRREARRRRHERVAAQRRGVAAAGAGDWLETKERLQWLQSRLDELTVQEKELLFHRFGLGRSLRAVGAALGLSGNAAHGRIRRLLDRLRGSAGKVL